MRTADPVTVEFRLLETTRVYAMGRLTESGSQAEVARRHALYLLGVVGTIDDERRTGRPQAHLAACRRRVDEVHAALEWAFSTTGDPAVGVTLTIAAIPSWFELFQMTMARARLEQAIRHVEPDSDAEMRLTVATGHVLWYLGPGSNSIEPTFTRALEIAERRGAAKVRAQAIWGLWAARRTPPAIIPAALQMALQRADAAETAGDPRAIHLADRILGLTHHVMGQQATARVFTERALRQPHDFNAASGVGYQESKHQSRWRGNWRVSYGGFRACLNRRCRKRRRRLYAAQSTGRSFPLVYADDFLAGLPVALWTGALEEMRHQAGFCSPSTARANPRTEQWSTCVARILELRERDAGGALTASFIEAHLDAGARPAVRRSAFRGGYSGALARSGAGRRDVEHAGITSRRRGTAAFGTDAPGAVAAARSEAASGPWRSPAGSRRRRGSFASP